jgi:hypothetical protein
MSKPRNCRLDCRHEGVAIQKIERNLHRTLSERFDFGSGRGQTSGQYRPVISESGRIAIDNRSSGNRNIKTGLR